MPKVVLTAGANKRQAKKLQQKPKNPWGMRYLVGDFEKLVFLAHRKPLITALQIPQKP